MLRMSSLLESRNSLLHLWTSLERKRIHPKISPKATGCFLNPESRHQNGATLWCSARQNWGTERAFRGPQRNLMEFTIDSNEIQYIVIRNSKLAGPRRSASRWTNQHRKTTPIVHYLKSSTDIGKTGICHWTNQAEMHRWNSDQTSEKQSQACTVSTASWRRATWTNPF